MGHLVGKDIYRKLGKKVDGLSVRAPNNKALYAILKELYTSDEAELIVKMPYNPASITTIQKITGFDLVKLQNMLNNLAGKGLIIDFNIGSRFQYRQPHALYNCANGHWNFRIHNDAYPRRIGYERVGKTFL